MMYQINRSRSCILILFVFCLISCSEEDLLQNPQAAENVESLIEDIDDPKINVAVKFGFGDKLNNGFGDQINVLYNLVVYNSIAINLLELPDVKFIHDDSINGTWNFMIEFRLFPSNDGSYVIYWIILENADNSTNGKTRAVFYPDISLGTIYYVYEADSIGNKVVEKKQYAPEGNENQKAKVAINIHKDSEYKENAYNSIARALVVLPDVEFESDSSINSEWDYMVEFGTLINDGTRSFAYWTTLQNADNSDSELRKVFYPEINIGVQDFAELQNVGREIVEQFRSNYLDTH